MINCILGYRLLRFWMMLGGFLVGGGLALVVVHTMGIQEKSTMLKLKRLIKPYIALLLAAVVLLFGQAMLELTLPNYMSDIVNVGLQQGGITQSAPEAIDQQSMAMMQIFMSEEDRETVNGAYRELEEGESFRTQKTYPTQSWRLRFD